MSIDNFIRLIEFKTGHTVKKSGHGYTACCPAHEDSTPSLSISHGNDGRVLVNCFSGCNLKEICSSVGIEISELFSKNISGGSEEIKKRILYTYHDEQGDEMDRIEAKSAAHGIGKSFLETVSAYSNGARAWWRLYFAWHHEKWRNTRF